MKSIDIHVLEKETELSNMNKGIVSSIDDANLAEV